MATGTGGSGWAASIHRSCGSSLGLPSPSERSLAFFVREAWPSIATGTECTEGIVGEDPSLDVVSRMEDGGVIFGDGIEADAIEFPWGARAEVRVSERSLNLVSG